MAKQRIISPSNAIYLFLFFISGMCGLIYEIAWTRRLTLILGLSSYSVVTVLSIFMIGLAAGSALGGRYFDKVKNPLKVYGILEGSIGIAGLAVTFLLDHFALAVIDFSTHFTPGINLSIFRVVITSQFLLAPTLMLGATFPIMNRIMTSKVRNIGPHAGLIYSINTFGGVTGAFLAGFVLLAQFGLLNTELIAIGLNLLIAALAIALSARWQGEMPSLEQQKINANTPMILPSILVLSAAFFAGFTFLAFETVSSRLLSLILGNSSWAFSTILCSALTGIAIGSWIISRFFKTIEDSSTILFLLLSGVSVMMVLMIPAWDILDKIQALLTKGEMSLFGLLGKQFILAMTILTLPSVIMGCLLPMCIKIYCVKIIDLGKETGFIYAVNSTGSFLGTAMTGLILLPLLGSKYLFLLLGLINFALAGILVFFAANEKKKTAYITILGGTVLLILFSSINTISIGRSLPGYETVYAKEGRAGLIAVLQSPDSIRVLNINNVTEVATDEVSLQTFRMMAAIPSIIHTDIEKALIITFGAGIASGTLSDIGIADLTCVEIVEETFITAQYFKKENYNVAENRAINFIVEDGRNFLARTHDEYDLISSDATHPTGADSWVLFTQEFYQLSHDKLSPGGLFTQWIPLHGLSKNSLTTIIATAQSIFPEIQLWFTGMDRGIGHLLIVGANDPVSMTYAQFKERINKQKIQELLIPYGINAPEVFGQYYLGNQNSLKPLYESARINTDNRAYTSFPDHVVTFSDVQENMRELFSLRKPPAFIVFPEDERAEYVKFFTARKHFWDAQLTMFDNNLIEALAKFKEAVTTNPEDPKLTTRIGIIVTNITSPIQAMVRDLEASRDLEKALALLLQLSDILPEQALPHADIGRVYLMKGEFENALRHLLTASQSPSADYTLFYNLGVCYMEMNDLDNAENAFIEVVKLNDKLAEGYSNLGAINFERGDIQDARYYWERALKINPEDRLARQGMKEIGG